MLVSGVFALMGYELVLFVVFMKIFATRGFLLPDCRLEQAFRIATLEMAAAGGALALAGMALLLLAVVRWAHAGYGSLASTCVDATPDRGGPAHRGGVETIFASFVLRLLAPDNVVEESPAVVLGPEARRTGGGRGWAVGEIGALPTLGSRA